MSFSVYSRPTLSFFCFSLAPSSLNLKLKFTTFHCEDAQKQSRSTFERITALIFCYVHITFISTELNKFYSYFYMLFSFYNSKVVFFLFVLYSIL